MKITMNTKQGENIKMLFDAWFDTDNACTDEFVLTTVKDLFNLTNDFDVFFEESHFEMVKTTEISDENQMNKDTLVATRVGFCTIEVEIFTVQDKREAIERVNKIQEWYNHERLQAEIEDEAGIHADTLDWKLDFKLYELAEWGLDRIADEFKTFSNCKAYLVLDTDEYGDDTRSYKKIGRDGTLHIVISSDEFAIYDSYHFDD